jgi:hypothetical protein
MAVVQKVPAVMFMMIALPAMDVINQVGILSTLVNVKNVMRKLFDV